jgi:hypothetical protein
MTLKVVVIVFELGFLGTALPMFGEVKTNQPTQVTVTTTEHASFAPGGTIRINHSYGNLNVEGWDQRVVQLTVIKSMPLDYKPKRPEEATRHLSGLRIALEAKSGTEVVVSTMRTHRRGVRVEYEIQAPWDSKLVIHHGAGSVSVSGLHGAIEATCSRGDILLMLPEAVAYSIDARSKFGTVLSDFAGTSHMYLYLLGERYATAVSPARRIRLRIGFGGITIKAAPPEAYAPQAMK